MASWIARQSERGYQRGSRPSQADTRRIVGGVDAVEESESFEVSGEKKSVADGCRNAAGGALRILGPRKRPTTVLGRRLDKKVARSRGAVRQVNVDPPKTEKKGVHSTTRR